MSAQKGYKSVAVIKMCGINYHFAIYEDGYDYSVGDRVLVSGNTYSQNCVISEIITPEEAHERYKKNITAEVICPIDFSKYEERQAKRKRVDELKKDINKRIKEIDEIQRYRMYAEMDNEFKKLLTQYESLTETQ